MRSQTRTANKPCVKQWGIVTLCLLATVISGCALVRNVGQNMGLFFGRWMPNDYEVTVAVPGWTLLWEQSSVFTFPNAGDSEMAATKGILVVVGASKRGSAPELLAYDGGSGAIVWTTAEGNAGAIAASDNAVYLGTRLGEVARLGTATGSPAWRRQVLGLNNVADLIAQPDTLIARSPTGETVALDMETGQVVQRLNVPVYDRIFWMGDDMWLSRGEGLHTLTANEPGLVKVLWQVALDDEVLEAPIVFDSRIYVHTGAGVGILHCLDRSTGATLWQSESFVLGNVATDGEFLFMLTPDGRLERLNGGTAQGGLIVSFQPSSFPLRSDRGGYYLAFDSSAHLLYVALGDSDQLLAFQETHD